jgi:hypothetical protein
LKKKCRLHKIIGQRKINNNNLLTHLILNYIKQIPILLKAALHRKQIIYSKVKKV